MKKFDEKPTFQVIGWTDFDNETFPECEITDEVIDAIVRELREKQYIFGGDAHQEAGYCCPVLSNGTRACFSWREWGMVVAMAYNFRGEDGNYDHLSGYMDSMIYPQSLHYPKEEQVNYSLLQLDPPQKTVDVVLPASCSVTDSAILYAFPCTPQLEQLHRFDYVNLWDTLPQHQGVYKKEVVLAVYYGPTLQDACDFAQSCGEEIWKSFFNCPEDLSLDRWFAGLYPNEKLQNGVVIVKGDLVEKPKLN